MKRKDFELGLLTRLALLPGPWKKLVACSYNGTVLPPLPEWDQETYPYACIYRYNSSDTSKNSYSLWISSSPIYLEETDYGMAVHALKPSLASYFRDWEQTDWANMRTGGYGGGQLLQYYEFIWCNTPITYRNTVAHEASEPVPIYE